MAWALGAVACGSSGGTAPTDAGTDDLGSTMACSLAIQPSMAVTLTPSQEVTLRVAVTPATAGAVVHFGLLGTALDGTLTATRALTDATGTAAVSLLAPSAAASFRVRASADCGADAWLDVSVGTQGFGALEGTVTYQGAWQPTALAVSVVRIASCGLAGAVPADRMVVLSAAGGTARFSGLPAGLDYVLTATAMGTGALDLATGCAGPLHVVMDQTTPVVVLFHDNPLAVVGTYDLVAGLDLSAETAQATPRWTAPIAAEVARQGGDALVIAADVAAAVAGAAPTGQGPTARLGFETALGDHLATEVSAALTSHGLSVGSVFLQAAVTIARIAARAHAAAVLTIEPAGAGPDGGMTLPDASADGGVGPANEGPLRQLQYTLDPETPDISLDDVTVLVDGTARGRFVPGMGDAVTLALDGMPLPYTRVATAAESALAGRIGVASIGEYVALAVCPVVVPLLVPATGACDAACVDAACHTAVDRLGTDFDAAVASTDPARTTVDLTLSGTARTQPGTLSIQTLAGMATGAFRDDPSVSVSATVSVTSRATP